MLIRSDSPAAVASVERWLFTNNAVAGADDEGDLLEYVDRLHRKLAAFGCAVHYATVEREANVLAALSCAEALDQQDDERRRYAQERLECAREALARKKAEARRKDELEALERDILEAFAEQESQTTKEQEEEAAGEQDRAEGRTAAGGASSGVQRSTGAQGSKGGVDESGEATWKGFQEEKQAPKGLRQRWKRFLATTGRHLQPGFKKEVFLNGYRRAESDGDAGR